MERTVEFILEGVKKIEMLADGKVRVLCVKEEVSENKVLKNNLSDMFVYIDFKNFIESEVGKKIMAHKPTTPNEEDFKELLEAAIEAKVENFYCSKIDPIISDEGENIIFEVGKRHKEFRAYEWWERRAKEFWPEHNSRLGSKLQYAAFLGVLMQKLVESGKTVEWAWYAVCNDSTELGCYYDSENEQDDFEPTGSKEICGFCDLANIDKLLEWDYSDECFWLASGKSGDFGAEYPLTSVVVGTDRFCTRYSVGWLVLS